jgi:hypothetical protein
MTYGRFPLPHGPVMCTHLLLHATSKRPNESWCSEAFPVWHLHDELKEKGARSVLIKLSATSVLKRKCFRKLQVKLQLAVLAAHWYCTALIIFGLFCLVSNPNTVFCLLFLSVCMQHTLHLAEASG